LTVARHSRPVWSSARSAAPSATRWRGTKRAHLPRLYAPGCGPNRRRNCCKHGANNNIN